MSLGRIDQVQTSTLEQADSQHELVAPFLAGSEAIVLTTDQWVVGSTHEFYKEGNSLAYFKVAGCVPWESPRQSESISWGEGTGPNHKGWESRIRDFVLETKGSQLVS